jgi:hypothetical protein
MGMAMWWRPWFIDRIKPEAALVVRPDARYCWNACRQRAYRKRKREGRTK